MKKISFANKLTLGMSILFLATSLIIVGTQVTKAAAGTQLTSLYTAQKTVTTSGTPVQLDTREVPLGNLAMVKSDINNTDEITIGGTSASALNSGTAHVSLLPGQAITFPVSNFDVIWIDAKVNGEGVELAIVE